MDAVEYLKTKRKMCETFQSCCINCPLKGDCGMPTDPKGNVKAVEQWAKEHPPKTRQSEFLKMFPNADLLDGVVNVVPCTVDKTLSGDSCANTTCFECTRKYWREKIE